MPDTTNDPQHVALRDDLIWGVPAMAVAAGVPLTRMQYLVRVGVVSVRRLAPKTLVTTHRQLKRDLLATSKSAKGATA